MSAVQNIIGNAGETLVSLRLTKHGVFNTYFLGEKAPVVDFLIEINDERTPYYALVQVKTTNAPQNRYRADGAIITPVPNAKLAKLWERPMPSYVVGADLVDELIHIAPAYKNDGNYPAIPARLKIDNKNKNNDIAALNLLKEDIIHFYQSHNIPAHKDNYQSLLPQPPQQPVP